MILKVIYRQLVLRTSAPLPLGESLWPNGVRKLSKAKRTVKHFVQYAGERASNKGIQTDAVCPPRR